MPLAEGEIILRRIPGSPEQIAPLGEGTFRASSFALKPNAKKGDPYPSFSRLSMTSPRALLQYATNQGIDTIGWRIARLIVADVVAAGWKVEHTPTVEDPGHCEIQPAGKPFSDSGWSRLARKTRILTAEEVAITEAGQALK